MCCIVLLKAAFFVIVCVFGSQVFVMVVVFLPLLKPQSGSSLRKASLDTDVVSIEASALPTFTVSQPSI